MKALRKKIYLAAGYNTISMGTGRKEFNPKKERPGLEHYIKEAGQGCIEQLGNASLIDEVIFGNFMASKFNSQANLAGFAAYIDPKLRHKPASRLEGACCSGGLALHAAVKSVLAETADIVMALGVEVQNTVKAIYGADILAGAGWYPKRKEGHAYFFPGQFSNRAGAYAEAYGEDYLRKGAAQWYLNAIENARKCPTAQEYHNKMSKEECLNFAMKKPNGKFFVDHLNLADCSKVSDGASAIAVLSEEGLKKAKINKKDCIELIGFSQAVRDITVEPDDLTALSTIKFAVNDVLNKTDLTIRDMATIELHDCFSIAGILCIEAMGLADKGKGAEYISKLHTSSEGEMPINTTGGLIGWGHPTGATGVHQAVTLWEQLTQRAGEAQVNIPRKRPYAMSLNMGGDDVTVLACIFKQCN